VEEVNLQLEEVKAQEVVEEDQVLEEEVVKVQEEEVKVQEVVEEVDLLAVQVQKKLFKQEPEHLLKNLYLLLLIEKWIYLLLLLVYQVLLNY
jgi:hypothetical protein